MIVDTTDMVDIGDRIVRKNTSQGARIAVPHEFTNIRYNRYVNESNGVIVLVPYERW